MGLWCTNSVGCARSKCMGRRESPTACPAPLCDSPSTMRSPCVMALDPPPLPPALSFPLRRVRNPRRRPSGSRKGPSPRSQPEPSCPLAAGRGLGRMASQRAGGYQGAKGAKRVRVQPPPEGRRPSRGAQSAIGVHGTVRCAATGTPKHERMGPRQSTRPPCPAHTQAHNRRSDSVVAGQSCSLYIPGEPLSAQAQAHAQAHSGEAGVEGPLANPGPRPPQGRGG